MQWYIRNAYVETPMYPSTDGRLPGYVLYVTSRMFITACKAVNYRVILTQLATFYVLYAALSKRRGRLAHTAEISALKNVVIFQKIREFVVLGAPIKF